MMRPVQVEIGITDSRFVELVREKTPANVSGRRPRPESGTAGSSRTDTARPSGAPRQILSEGTELVINAQAGVKTGTTTQGGLFGAPRGGGRGGGGGPR